MTLLLPILHVILIVLNLYIWILIINVIFSWLYAFNVINSHNQFVAMVGRFLYEVTEPALRPIRRFVHKILPNLGGLDISPMVLILLIFLISMYINMAIAAIR